LTLHKAHPTRALLPAFGQAIAALEGKGDRARAFELLEYAVRSFPGQGDALEKVAGSLLRRALNEGDQELAAKTLDLLPRPGLATALRQFLEKLDAAPAAETLESHAALLRRMRQVKLADDERKALTSAVVRLAAHLLTEARWSEIQELHTTWPAVELGPALAQSVLALATVGTVETEDAALAILRYANAGNLRDVPEIQAAAVQLAKRGGSARGEDSYSLILSVQRAFPIPELLDVAATALRDLIKREAQDQALSFVASARVEFGSSGQLLLPQVVGLLRSLPMDQASRDLAVLRDTVQQGLQGRSQEEHRWQLECGDMYLAIGSTEKATDLWSELTTAGNVEPDLVCRAAIRLCGSNLSQGQPLPLVEIWAPAMAEGFPEETRLLARYVTGGLVSQELEAGLRRLGAPKFFSDAEWDIARALRAHSEGRTKDAQQLLLSAAKKAGPHRAWPSYLMQEERKTSP
jgi:hypothetical protein